LNSIVIPKPKEITKADLEKFVGEYELRTQGFCEIIYQRRKNIYAFIEAQPEYELVPVEKNKFELKVMKGYSVLFEK
jgi:hypothetical protein